MKSRIYLSKFRQLFREIIYHRNKPSQRTSVDDAEGADKVVPTVSIERVADLRVGLAAAKRLGATLAKTESNPLAISVPEICAINYLLSNDRNGIRRIAELGTFLGWTANLLADLSHKDAKIEIYDFFSHNEQSVRSLKSHPKFSPSDFFDIWSSNTRNHQNKFEVYRGDLNDTVSSVSDSLDLLFVDIVKHTSLVNTIVSFYDRLRVGGYLCHQDYYHWQSPWIVYQMELLDGAFSRLEDFGNNMTVYVKTRALLPNERDLDYVLEVPRSRQYELFDRAIARHPGLRAGNLMASKLRLALNDTEFDHEALQADIMLKFGDNSRIAGYTDQIMNLRNEISDMMW